MNNTKNKSKIFISFILIIITSLVILFTFKGEMAIAVLDKINPFEQGVTAQKYMVINLKNGRIIKEKGVYDKVTPASISKLFSIEYANEIYGLNETIDIEQNAYDLVIAGSKLANLVPGRYYTLNVYHGLLSASGNDLALGMASAIGYRLEPKSNYAKEAIGHFTESLDEHLKSIGINNTKITNPSGYSYEDYTTINDIHQVVTRLLKNEWFRTLISQKNVTTITPNEKALSWDNTNEFLDPNSSYYNPDIKGVKTGSLSSYYNIITLYQKDGNEYLIYVFGAKTNDRRYSDVEKLIEDLY
ncbi:MAG: hypothetical protein GXY87_05785 [Tissierellia bacterium]|nr:hypothetical protein [Tissierellia bacterium]